MKQKRAFPQFSPNASDDAPTIVAENTAPSAEPVPDFSASVPAGADHGSDGTNELGQAEAAPLAATTETTPPAAGNGSSEATMPWNPDIATTEVADQAAPSPAYGFDSMGASAPAATPVAQPAAGVKKKSMRGLIVLILVSYASALTIAFIFLLMKLNNPNPHDLESLPDLVPDIGKNGEIGLRLAPRDATMAKGHTLQLGESQRFGSVRVTPVKVTKGPLEFEYYDRDPTKTKPATAPVLKLWLKFENVSDKQVFPPLDRKLLLSRAESNKGSEFDRANMFVCKASQRKKGGDRLLVYELPETSSWDFKAQPLGNNLAPGESMQTYVPSAEAKFDELTGQLVWRVQFRKGYNPKSLRGVTTLIEVKFDSSEIMRDAA